MNRRLASGFLLGLGLVAPFARAQLVVKLSPKTIAEFESYTGKVKAETEQRWSGKKSFLSVDENAHAKETLLGGDVFIQQMNGGRPVAITDALIHDWLGAIYIPNRRAEDVIAVLEDFDNHKNIYPAVAESRLLRREGHHVSGYWQLRQKGIIPVILDVEQDATYQQISRGKWNGEAYARNIVEVDTGILSDGRKFPPGEGHGYLWRLYSYWSLESVQGGVLAECRTLSLSRDVPERLSWAIAPYLQKMPRESLASTLKRTRAALEK